MASAKMLLQALNRRAPDKQWRLEGLVGFSDGEYWLSRNKLRATEREAPIYKIACENIEPAIIGGQRIEITTRTKRWQVPKPRVDADLAKIVRQLVAESKGFIVTVDRQIY